MSDNGIIVKRDPATSRQVRDRRGDWLDRLPLPASERPSRMIALATLAFVAAMVLTLAFVLTAGDDGGELTATKMTLELAYPTSGAPTANMEGQPGAAPAGTVVACRSTTNQLKLGDGVVNADGSFDVALDASAWPLEMLTGEAYRTLNTTIECRAGDGPWVQPLRPPRVAIQ